LPFTHRDHLFTDSHVKGPHTNYHPSVKGPILHRHNDKKNREGVCGSNLFGFNKTFGERPYLYKLKTFKLQTCIR